MIPFTNPWQDNIPGDGTQASLIGADIRQLRLDVSDRMGFFVSDWESNQNGLTLTPVAGGSTSITVNYPAGCWKSDIADQTQWFGFYNNTDNSFSVNTTAGSVGTITLMCPLILPLAGNVLTKCSVFYDQAAGIGALPIVLAYTQPAGVAGVTPVTVSTVNTTGTHVGGSQTAVVFTGSYTMLGGQYYLGVTIPSTSVTGVLLKIYGSGSTYTRPNIQFAP